MFVCCINENNPESDLSWRHFIECISCLSALDKTHQLRIVFSTR